MVYFKNETVRSYYLNALERLGYIKIERNHPRGYAGDSISTKNIHPLSYEVQRFWNDLVRILSR
jgi:hypothetical protein